MMDKIRMKARSRRISANFTPEAKRNPYPPILFSPYTEKGGVKPSLSPLSEFGEGVGGGVKRATVPTNNSPLSAPSAGLAFRLAGGFNPWRRWCTLLFALVMAFGVMGSVQGQEKNVLKVLVVSDDPSTPEFEQYLDKVTKLLNEQGIQLDISFDQIIPVEDFPTETHLIIDREGGEVFQSLFIRVNHVESMPLPPFLHSLPYRLGFSPRLDLKADEDVDMREFNPILTVALGFYALGRCQDAVPFFEKALEAVYEINVSDTDNPAESDAIAYYTGMIMNNHDQHMAFFWGNCAVIDKDYLFAIEQFRKGLSAHRPAWLDPAYSVNLAWTYLQLGDEEQAFSPKTWAVLSDGDVDIKDETKVFALSNRAQLYTLVERYDDAISDLTAALELDPETRYLDEGPYLHTLRGQMYLALYEWDNALADYNAALELAPDYADAYYYRGVLYASILQTGLDKRDEALADFRRYLELAPDGDHAKEAAQAIADLEAAEEALNP